MMIEELQPFILYFVVPILGLCVGSFILELADRLPRHEDFIKKPSHCEACGRRLSPLDLVPVISFLALEGKCRYCGQKLSPLYPLVECISGLSWFLIFFQFGITLLSCLYALFASALLGLSLIDARTGIIPPGFPIFIGCLGILRLLLETFYFGNKTFWQNALIGAAAVSLPLLLIYFLSKGAAIGGGDIKLMAASGLLLGWKQALLGFVLACVLGSVIHLIRMRFSQASRVLRMGPYLSLGLYLSLLTGEKLIAWYSSLFYTG